MKILTNWPTGFRVNPCDDFANSEVVPADFFDDSKDVAPPDGTTLYYERLAREEGTTKLSLPYKRPEAKAPSPEKVLDTTPTQFEITFLADKGGQWSEHPFFFQDAQHTFFVTRKEEPVGKPPGWTFVDRISIDARFGGMRDWADPATASPPLHVTYDSSPSVTRVAGPEVAAGGTATTRLLTGISGLLPTKNTLATSREPSSVKVVINYRVGGTSETFAVGGGSASSKTIVVAHDVTIPAVSPATPIDTLVPAKDVPVDRYLFEPFFHPYVCDVIRQLHKYGVDGLLDPSPSGDNPGLRRQALEDVAFFGSTYHPGEPVAHPRPVKEFDFSPSGAYSVYNWELFFHAPLLVAKRLVADQRFEQALRWFHSVFHPMERAVPSEPVPDRAWKIRPFYEAGTLHGIDDLLGLLTYSGDDPEISKARQAMEAQISDWRAHPFEPHRLARLRSGTYQRYVVIEYIKALVAWGDMLFRRETLEAANEALQLYILAASILGRRPERVEKPTVETAYTYRSLTTGAALDAFSSALIKAETLLPASTIEVGTDTALDMPTAQSFVFCVPPNESLTDLWDLVEDRLFKLRHCMNIDGVVRQLPLFEPPIDPALLVRAAANGVDVGSVLSDLSGPLPARRFRVLVQKALEVCGEVRSFGASLLGALEKSDAEELAGIRATQEREVLEANRTVRKAQIAEAEASLQAMQRSADAAELRRQYYSTIPRTIPQEDEQQRTAEEAGQLQLSAQVQTAIGSGLALVPQVHAGFAAAVENGGQMFHNYYGAWASIFGAMATSKQIDSGRAGHQAMVERRAAEWRFQASVAAADKKQIEQQMIAQQIRIAIAGNELELLDRQIDNAKAVEEYLRTKYTNQELYGWMVDQTSDMYATSYKLAYDLAKQAQRAFQFERGEPNRTFVQFGEWQDLRKGLLAGDRLMQDLRTMEAAFLREDRRELELTKHVSLAEINPWALITLRETGVCELELPEALFDMDTPGHYMRRARSIAITIPSVTGPYVPVRCTLTQLSSQVRRSTKTIGSPAEPKPDELVRSDVAIESIVTSHGREDSGMFDGDRGDERYLPFEGAGVVGRYRLELPSRFPSFDFRTIEDVVLHVRYTARDGGKTFANAVSTSLLNSTGGALTPRPDDALGPFALMVSVKNEYPDVWHSLFHPQDGWSSVDLTLPLDSTRLPHAIKGHTVKILDVRLVAPTGSADPSSLRFHVTPPGDSITGIVQLSETLAGQPSKLVKLDGSPIGSLLVSLQQADLTLFVPALVEGNHLKEGVVDDLVVIVRYAFAPQAP